MDKRGICDICKYHCHEEVADGWMCVIGATMTILAKNGR